MERSSIDLNQHAFDLNEVPLTDLNASFPGSSSPNGLAKPWLPKKGGWLELFCKMFGHESLVMNDPTTSGISSGLFTADYRLYCDPMVFNGQNLQTEPNSHYRLHEKGKRNGKSSASRSDSMMCNGHTMQNEPDFHSKHRNEKFSGKHSGLHGNSILCDDQSLKIGADFRQNYDKRKLTGIKGCEKQVLSHGLEVPSIFHLPCLPMIEKINPGLGACNSNTHNRNGLDSFSQGDKSCSINSLNKVICVDPEQENTSLASTKALLKDCLEHSLPIWDLNYFPSPVFNVDFQSPPQTFQSANIHQQSTLYSANILGKTPERSPIPIIKNRQKCSCAQPLSNTFETILCSRRSESGTDPDVHSMSNSRQAYGIPKKINELSITNDYNCPPDGSKTFDRESCEDIQPSSLNWMKDQEPRVKIIASPDWLPEGWITELKRRQCGSTAGTTDKYYKDPVTGHRFRSKNEVMNYLQTGNSCRHKPLLKPSEASIPINVSPYQLPPKQLLDHFQPLAADHNFSSLATNIAPIDLNRQCTSSEGLVSERISIKREDGEDISDGSFEQNFSRNSATEVLTIGRSDPSSEELLVSSAKRKMHHNNYVFASTSKRLCSTAKEEEEEEDNIQQLSTLPSFLKKRGGTMSHRMDNIDARVLHPTGDELPITLEENSSQDRQISQSFLVNSKVNEKLLAPFCTNQISDTIECNDVHIGTMHRQKGLINITYEKKVPKLTLKQERELFISLGRRLCQEFISSVNGTLEHQVTNKP